MDPIAKNVEKQLIVRCFLPDMQRLKATAKQLSQTTPDIKLGLYGQAGEVLVVVNARAYAQAAATELTQNAADQFEETLGAAVYGRGKGGLAYVTAGELIENEAVLTAADEMTGRLLSEEFGNTKRGPQVFDFGAQSYDNPKIAAKIEAAANFGEENTSPLQTAADYAFAAAKAARADFGCAVSGLENAQIVYAAVAHKGKVHIRKIAAGPDAGKAAALSILDMTRRILMKEEIPYAKMFRAGREIDWNNAEKKKKGNKYIVPITILCVLLVALGAAVWYLWNTFFIKDQPSAPVDVPSVSQSVAQPDQSASAPAQSTPAPTPETPKNSGVVHPFA